MPINMNEKSKIKNLCPFPISWKRITIIGDEYLKPNASVFVLNSEIYAQVESRNIMLAGNDQLGSHAMAYIENDELREDLKFDDKADGRKQNILNDEKCESIINSKFSAFKKSIEENVVTQHEKMKIIASARKSKLNDYDKIEFLQTYCGLKFKES